MNEFVKLGKHFTCELSGCDRTILCDNDQIKILFTQAAANSGLSIVGEGRFDFSPQGFSCYLLLAESHASIHVWPEYGYCAVDLFTCNLEIDTAPFFTAVKESFGADHSLIQMIKRGCLTRKGRMIIEPTMPVVLTHTTVNEPGQLPHETPWGWHLILNLYQCDPDLIGSYEVIEKFVIDLCELIKMRRFGDPVIVNFGDDPNIAGYSMFQLIESSSLSGHFPNKSGAAYLDIFSCKEFDPQIAVNFCIETFKAKKAEGRLIYRG